ncbi:hypothetical protein KUV61_17810 [Nocardioides marinus]|nr:hypothetical protein [Nocardioides marinus]
MRRRSDPSTHRSGCAACRLARGAAAALMLAPPVAAGAWLEPVGAGFTSASATFRTRQADPEPELSFYGAYGLTPGVTLGVDLNSNRALSGHAVLFARLPLHQGPTHRVAAELGLGGNRVEGRWHMMQKATLSYGRGFQTGAGHSGWIAVDASYELRNSRTQPIWKLDGTLGLNTGAAFAPMIQLETAWPQGGQPSYTLTPSLRYQLPERRELLIGLALGHEKRSSFGLKLGLWQKF